MNQAAPIPPESLAPRIKSLADAFTVHHDHLRRVADRGLEADLMAKVGASDIVQDTFYTASRDLDQYRGETPGELRGWLEQILQHRLAFVRRYFRGSAKRRVSREIRIGSATPGVMNPLTGDIAAAPTASPLSRFVEIERVEALRVAVAGLPERDREVIVWHQQDRLSFKAIGEQLQISEDAARKRWARAIVHLRAALESNDDSR